MSFRPISLLLDPKIDISDVKVALKHSSLEIVGTESSSNIYIVKLVEAEPARLEAATL